MPPFRFAIAAETGFLAKILATQPKSYAETGFLAKILATQPKSYAETRFLAKILATQPKSYAETRFLAKIFATQPKSYAETRFLDCPSVSPVSPMTYYQRYLTAAKSVLFNCQIQQI